MFNVKVFVPKRFSAAASFAATFLAKSRRSEGLVVLKDPQYDFLMMPTSAKVPDWGNFEPEIVTEVALNQSKRSPTKPKLHLPPSDHDIST